MNRFKLLRYERGLTQEQLADGAGIARGTVIRLENLSEPMPSAEVALALSKFYGMPMATLLGSDEEAAA